MPDWQANDVEANGIHLHYTRTGGAKPPVVLAHGFSDNGLCWTPVAEALAATYDIIMVDARGHGLSTAPQQGYASDDHAADLAGVIRTLGLQRPAVLGHSMGAAATLALAGTYPDLVGSILLEDPPLRWLTEAETAGFDPAREASRRAWITGLQSKTRAELIADQRAQTPHWSAAELEPWADAKLQLSLNVLNRPLATTLDWPATVQQITCPALLITADPARGAIVSAEDAAALQALVPQLRIAHILEAGHSIRRDQFARYMDAVRAFLAETTAQSTE
jgi:N-formylmaleamate deformylase